MIQGVSGLAAVSLAGCPKLQPEPVIPVSEVLSGTGVSEGAVLAAVRAMGAAAEPTVSLMLQRRNTLVLSRDRFGPAVRQDVTHGAVARVVSGTQTREAASNRTEDDTLPLLLSRVGIPAVEPLADGEAPSTALIPVRVPERMAPAPAVDVVGAALAFVIVGVSLRVPEHVEAVWEQVVDDRLWILADGRLVRAMSSWGRLSLDAVFPTASGSTRIRRTASSALFDSPDGDAIQREVMAIGQAVTAQGTAVTPSSDARTVVLDAEVALLVALAAGRAGWQTPFEEGPWQGFPAIDDTGAEAASAAWSGQWMRRVAWNTEPMPLPRQVRLAASAVGASVQRSGGNLVRISRARIRFSDSQAILLEVDDGRVEVEDSHRALRAGSRLRIPRSSIERLTFAEAAPRTSRAVVTGPLGASLIVDSGLPAIALPGCLVEGPDGGA
ncbi:MAG TPA: hypothetical protein DFR83_18395 [Deltaproteobacteria bacterium]|nr:hypothetical protein [Deltaproteobacteria bacterium]